MSVFLTDGQIKALIGERKVFSSDLSDLSNMKSNKAHKEWQTILERKDGSAFKLILRRNTINPIDFSAILGYMPPNSNQVFRLLRYNGKSHEHTNRKTEPRFYDFHIHKATEEYQRNGLLEDFYAEPTDQYSDLHGALTCLINDCNINYPNDGQLDLRF